MSTFVAAQSSVSLAAVDSPLASQLSKLLELAVTCFDQDMAKARDYIARAAELLSAPINASAGPATQIRRGGLATWQKQRLTDYIDQRLDKAIAIEDMAAVVRLSCSHFSRAFRNSFGTSPHDYIIQRRVNQAERLMLEGDAALAEISLDCGFADQAHFSRLFKRVTGETPNVWRRSRQIGPQSGGERATLRVA